MPNYDKRLSLDHNYFINYIFSENIWATRVLKAGADFGEILIWLDLF